MLYTLLFKEYDTYIYIMLLFMFPTIGSTSIHKYLLNILQYCDDIHFKTLCNSHFIIPTRNIFLYFFVQQSSTHRYIIYIYIVTQCERLAIILLYVHTRNLDKRNSLHAAWLYTSRYIVVAQLFFEDNCTRLAFFSRSAIDF